MPEGWDAGEERPEKSAEEVDDADLPELDKEEEERLKNDASLKWDDDEEKDEDEEKKDGDEDDKSSGRQRMMNPKAKPAKATT